MELAGVRSNHAWFVERSAPSAGGDQGAVGEVGLPVPEGAFGPGKQVADFGFPELPTAPPVVEGRLALIEFIRLADSSPATVRSFVANWGPLHLCRHHLPITHPPLPSETTLRGGQMCVEVDGDGTNGRERVEMIRSWARLAAATLRLGLDLSADPSFRGEPSNWRILGVSALPETPTQARRLLSHHINAWLTLGLARPQVNFVEKPRLQVATHEVFGVIALELARAAVSASMALCVVCGDLFTPTRSPRAGEDSYCMRAACKRAARAAASRRYRQARPVNRAR